MTFFFSHVSHFTGGLSFFGVCQWLDPGFTPNPAHTADPGEVAPAGCWRADKGPALPAIAHLRWHGCRHTGVHLWNAFWHQVSRGEQEGTTVASHVLSYKTMGCKVSQCVCVCVCVCVCLNSDSSPPMVYIILAVWTWSMLQFPLHFSGTAPAILFSHSGSFFISHFFLQPSYCMHRRMISWKVVDCHLQVISFFVSTVMGATSEDLSEPAPSLLLHLRTDIWSTVEALFIQDGPFLVVRLTVMIYFNVVHQMLIFFAIKNFLVVVLNIYRLSVLVCDKTSWVRMRSQRKKSYCNEITVYRVVIARHVLVYLKLQFSSFHTCISNVRWVHCISELQSYLCCHSDHLCRGRDQRSQLQNTDLMCSSWWRDVACSLSETE